MDIINSVFSSITSAIVTKSFVAPLERLKLLKQSQLYYGQQNYTSLYDSFKFIYKNEGPLGFYRGHYSNLVRIVPSYMLKFPTNEFYKKKLGVTHDAPFRQLLGGTLAGLTQITCTYPLDIIRTRMSLDNHMTNNYTNYITCAQNIIKQEGVKTFYKGFLISGLTYSLYVGIQFFIYEKLCDEGGIFGNRFIAGATAGLIAQSLMFPGDTIKRNLQINGIDSTKEKYSGPLSCIKNMYCVHGIRAFYAGYGVNMIKAMPEAALQFAIYDYVKMSLKDYF
jgi:solute carrier family 25 (mitochondrial phosphate transporter), member 23/24/25/41